MSGRQSADSDQRVPLMAASDMDLLAAVFSMTRTYNGASGSTLPVAEPHSTLRNKDSAGKETHSVLQVNLLPPSAVQ